MWPSQFLTSGKNIGNRARNKKWNSDGIRCKNSSMETYVTWKRIEQNLREEAGSSLLIWAILLAIIMMTMIPCLGYCVHHLKKKLEAKEPLYKLFIEGSNTPKTDIATDFQALNRVDDS